LLRRSYRDGDKVKNETLGNLSHLPDHVIELVRRSLRGEAFVLAEEHFEIIASKPHGDVDAVLQAMRQLDAMARYKLIRVVVSTILVTTYATRI
jgi:hypothetical protein